MLTSLVTFERMALIMGGIAGLIWAAVLFQHIRRGGRATTEHGLLLLLIATGPLIGLAQPNKVRATDFRGMTVDGPAQTGALLLLSQVLTAVAVVIAVSIWGRKMRGQRNAVTTALALFYFSLILSGVVGEVPGIPQGYLVTPLLVLAVSRRDDMSFERVVQVSSWAVRSVLVLSLAAMAVLPDSAFNYDDEGRTLGGIARLQGITAQPNMLGPIAVIGLLIELHRRKRLWVAVSFIVLLLTQSNTSMLAAVIAVLATTSVAGTIARRAAVGALLLAAAIALVAPSAMAQIVEYVVPPGADTLTGRTTIWGAALNGFERNPIFGYGPSLLNEAFRAQYVPGFDAAAQAHNQGVQTLGDAGLVGAAALVVLVVTLLRVAHRARSVSSLPFALVVALIVRGVTETPLRPTGVSISTMALLIVVAATVTAARQRSDTAEVGGHVNGEVSALAATPETAQPKGTKRRR